MARSFVVGLLAAACLGVSSGAQEPERSWVTATLKGGATVTGVLLRRNDEGVVLDLEHDVVHIPADRILDVREQAEAGGEAQEEASGDIYTLGRLEAAPIAKLVERVSDAVVTVRSPAGLGSGFIISKQGHLITNYHVVENEERISVSVYDRTDEGYRKRELKKVRILALNPLRDVALLELDISEIENWSPPEPVFLSAGGDLKVGDVVFAIGNPLGLERSVTQGVVSSATRTIGHLRFIQTDASINPGNSGGPLFNNRGEVVGIVSAGYVLFDGLAFGIPVSDLVDFLRNRDAFLYDPSQPQNGVKYLPPPYRPPEKGGDDGSGESES